MVQYSTSTGSLEYFARKNRLPVKGLSPLQSAELLALIGPGLPKMICLKSGCHISRKVSCHGAAIKLGIKKTVESSGRPAIMDHVNGLML
jgi:hypothetical protein